MDCGDVGRMLHDMVDGRLPPPEEEAVRRHVASCGSCAAEEAQIRRVGETLRLWAAARLREKEPQLDAMWTRVRAGIEERRTGRRVWAGIRRWFFIPVAAALAVLALLVYPSGVNRAPFHPSSFDVSVESLESDVATVAVVDKGENLPRVIWIIEDGRT